MELWSPRALPVAFHNLSPAPTISIIKTDGAFPLQQGAATTNFRE